MAQTKLSENKLSGLNIMFLLKEASDPTKETKVNPISLLTNDDLDTQDPLNIHFIEKHKGCDCCKAQSAPTKEALAAIYDDLNDIHNKLKARDYRSLFNSLQNNLNANNDAIVFERIASKYEPVKSGIAQIESIEKIKNLMKQASSDSEKKELIAMYDLVLTGEPEAIKKASEKTRTLYSNCVPQDNIKLAFTSLTQQIGEPYQMCPKMLSQIGHAVAMEVSKCRDNCIDVKIAKDGKIGCAYADWLKRADNNEKAMARLEVHLNMDEDNRLELKEGEREKAPTKEHKTLEQRGDQTRPKDNSQSWNNSIETQLNFNYKRDVAKKNKPDLTDSVEVQLKENHEDEISDETIEQILETERDPFTEDELDILEALIRDNSEG